jgi:hypothetical protein
MRIRIAGAVLAGIMMVTMTVAQAALGSGSLLNGTIDQNLSSNHAYVGETVTLSNVTSDDGSGSVIRGRLYGQVTEVQPAGQGTPGKLRMHFTRLVTPHGTYNVDTRVNGVQAQTKSNAGKEAGGALAGMLVGNAIGKTLFHLGGFGILGAAGGFLLAKNNRQNVNITAGTVVQVQVLSVSRRQAG